MSRSNSIDLAQIYAALKADTRLSPRQRQDWPHALGQVSQALAPEAESVGHALSIVRPGEPSEFARVLAALWAAHPKEVHPSLRTYISRSRAALRWLGYPIDDGHGHSLLMPCWTDVVANAGNDRADLLPLAYFMSGRGVAVAALTQADVDGYCQALLSKCERGPSRKRLSRLVRALNAQRHATGWPHFLIPPVVMSRERLAARPTELRRQVLQQIDEAARMLAARKAPWTPSTSTRVKRTLKLLLLAIGVVIAACDRDPHDITGIEDVCTPATFDAITRYYQIRQRQRDVGDRPAGPAGCSGGASFTAYEVLRILYLVAQFVLELPSDALKKLSQRTMAAGGQTARGLRIGSMSDIDHCLAPARASALWTIGIRHLNVALEHPEGDSRTSTATAVLFVRFALRFCLAPAQFLACQVIAGTTATNTANPQIQLATGILLIPASQYGGARAVEIDPESLGMVHAYVARTSPKAAVVPTRNDGADLAYTPLRRRQFNDAVAMLTTQLIGRPISGTCLRLVGIVLNVRWTKDPSVSARALVCRRKRFSDPLLDHIDDLTSQNQRDAISSDDGGGDDDA